MKQFRYKNRWVFLLIYHQNLVLLFCLCLLPSAFGQLTPGEIDQLKVEIRERLDDLNYYHSVASFVNLNLYTDISSSNFDIDNVGGSHINMIKIPFTYDIGPEHPDWAPFIEGNFSYMKAYSHIDSLESLLGPIPLGGGQEPYDETDADLE